MRNIYRFKVIAFGLLFQSFFSPLLAGNNMKIIYNIKYGFVNGGKAMVEKRDTVYGGKKCIYYRLEGNTTGLTDKIFKVHDTYESIVDARTHLPYLAVRNVKEKSYRYYNKVFFYHQNDSIFSERTGGMKVPPQLIDILSAFFYMVNVYDMDTLKEGYSLILPTINGHDIQKMKVKYVNNEIIQTDIGSSLCYVIAPEMKKGKLLKNSSSLKFYIAQNEKIPYQIEIETKVGKIEAMPIEIIKN
ncbi:MAG: DUF3108 domain-containing protein [Bacteroidales bacterium]|jgi:hypothetical protein|nr:DUF3108 domain-containing protein [Bacteroidales bacterium]